MLRAQEQYKTDKGKDVKLQECWDAWLDQQFGKFVNQGGNWIQNGITQLREKLKPEDSEEDDPLRHELYKAWTTILDLLKAEADEVIKISNFDLGITKSTN